MAGRRILLMHVTTSSGHHHASQAVVQGLRRLDPSCQVIGLDAFDYTSRFVRSSIMHSYMSMIRHYPDVWEYLYDNPGIHKYSQHIRKLLHRYHGIKLQRLLETTQAHAIACTQAFPCGMVADYKQHHGLTIPLVGVLTDFAPHLYWVHDAVDVYVVASEEVKQRFISQGISPERIRVYGIPVEPRFLDPVDRPAVASKFGLDLAKPIVMVMGGGGGFGPIREFMRGLDQVPQACQFVVLAGTNAALLDALKQQAFQHPVIPIGYIDTVPQLMDIATLIITKPGGLTTSESLAKHLPMLIISPIPGQELCNARHLLAQGAAIQLSTPQTARHVLAQLLNNPHQLARLKERAAGMAHPDSALRSARLLLDLADRYRHTIGHGTLSALPDRGNLPCAVAA